MELLKDLPSYDRENFSRFSQGSCKNQGKPYIRLKNGTEDKALEIVMDPSSLLLRDLEKEVRRCKKRGPCRDDSSRKVPRLETDQLDSDLSPATPH